MALIFRDKINKLRNITTSRLNYFCIMMEGLFNSLGIDIIGMTTIVPLFLRDYGASMTMVGALPTIQAVSMAVTPLIAGNFVATAKRKKWISLTFNGTARTSVLFLPLLLLIGTPNNVLVIVFFCIFTMFFICNSLTSIVWHNLLGTCVLPQQRGKLLGHLFAMSGALSFISANVVRILRENEAMTLDHRYAAIFGLGGILVACSVLFFIPLREPDSIAQDKNERTLKFYIESLFRCIKNKYFQRMIITQALSQICMTINTFAFIFANEHLGLSTQWISYMLIIQPVGVICGGLLTAQISARFGSKRTVLTAEILAIAIPILQLIALFANSTGMPINIAPAFMLAVTFIIGFNRSSLMAFHQYLLDVAGKENNVYFIVARSTILLPLSFISIFIGMYFDRFSHFLQPIYIFQICVSVAVIFCATRLKLYIFSKNQQ